MNAMELINTLANMDTLEEALKQGKSGEEYASDAVETLTTAIVQARIARMDQKRLAKVPTANFVEGNWSFRRITHADGVGFEIYPKGERSHWSRRGNIHQSGELWIAKPLNRSFSAFATFVEAKDHVLKVLGIGGR